jgi:hypothetical protein
MISRLRKLGQRNASVPRNPGSQVGHRSMLNIMTTDPAAVTMRTARHRWVSPFLSGCQDKERQLSMWLKPMHRPL